ncbi:MAG: DNA-3-methyladenine glycosylase [Cellulosilyticaceae bacterium]
MTLINQAFYMRDSLEVAKDLLGKILVREEEGLVGKFKIVETEAYRGIEDKGAHSYGGKKTERTKPMFEAGGITYIYLIYGMYNCLNIVTNIKENPQAVLIRAVEPLDEEAIRMCKQYRHIKSNKIKDLTNGPGKLCMALDIDRSMNELDVTKPGKIYILEGQSERIQIVQDKRINIDYAEEYKDVEWRFYIANNPFVSVLKKE